MGPTVAVREAAAPRQGVACGAVPPDDPPTRPHAARPLGRPPSDRSAPTSHAAATVGSTTAARPSPPPDRAPHRSSPPPGRVPLRPLRHHQAMQHTPATFRPCSTPPSHNRAVQHTPPRSPGRAAHRPPPPPSRTAHPPPPPPSRTAHPSPRSPGRSGSATAGETHLRVNPPVGDTPLPPQLCHVHFRTRVPGRRSADVARQASGDGTVPGRPAGTAAYAVPRRRRADAVTRRRPQGAPVRVPWGLCPMGATLRAARAFLLLAGFYLLGLAMLAALAGMDWAASVWAPSSLALKLYVVSAVLAVPIVRGMFMLRTPRASPPPASSSASSRAPPLADRAGAGRRGRHPRPRRDPADRRHERLGQRGRPPSRPARRDPPPVPRPSPHGGPDRGAAALACSPTRWGTTPTPTPVCPR